MSGEFKIFTPIRIRVISMVYVVSGLLLLVCGLAVAYSILPLAIAAVVASIGAQLWAASQIDKAPTITTSDFMPDAERPE